MTSKVKHNLHNEVKKLTEHLSRELPETVRFICTSNFGFSPYALEELRHAFPEIKSTVLIPGEVLLVQLPIHLDIIGHLHTTPLIFLRHIQPVQFEEEIIEEDAIAFLTKFLLENYNITHKRVAIQVRKTNEVSWQQRVAIFKQQLQSALEQLDVHFCDRDPHQLISIFLHHHRVYIGVSSPADNLSPWSGGEIRFVKQKNDISRAKFKLLEVEQTMNIPFSSLKYALDIGAAPGGWTSFLLDRQMIVTAVDPAQMSEHVRSNPRLIHIKQKINEVQFQKEQFDVIVCDMNWNPNDMARTLSNLLYSLRGEGIVLVTIKLLYKKKIAIIKKVIAIFENAGLVRLGAKQLFYNREEITLYMRKA